MKKTTCLVVALLFVIYTVLPLYARNEGCYRADRDAEEMEGGMKFVFFGAGCLLGPVGILLGYTVIPPVPENTLLGKSSAYVADYVSCYNETARGIQGLASLIGCGIFGLGVWGLYMWFVVIQPFYNL